MDVRYVVAVLVEIYAGVMTITVVTVEMYALFLRVVI
jgi:hypothetical protein